MTATFKNRQELIDAEIVSQDRVLDVGFWGQGTQVDDPKWIHGYLKKRAGETHGVDLECDPTRLEHPERYLKGSAEDFDFPVKFNKIFASEIIEHLSNPGKFLEACARNLDADGLLIITTPNCFNLYHIAEKFTKDEPSVNSDHTCYFNSKTLIRLLAKNGWKTERVSFVLSNEVAFKHSTRRKVLDVIYNLVARLTPKFFETLVIVAKKA